MSNYSAMEARALPHAGDGITAARAMKTSARPRLTNPTDWSNTPTGPEGYPTPQQILHPDGFHWWTESEQDDSDPAPTHMYADRLLWNRGCLDGLPQAVADQALVEVFVADTELQRIHHPYDGGADVMLATLQSVTVCVTNSHDQGVRQVECGRIRNHRGSRACGLRLRTPPSTAREPRASRQGSLTPSRSDNRPPTRA
ncbi:hypothetical protein ACFYVK_00480 [Streptomyces chartreusis]|uniref:DUF3885 domain-containing protein n=1 Tax=Streptomyces chartreusis TaxID=1969 RepID=UPI00369CD6C1